MSVLHLFFSVTRYLLPMPCNGSRKNLVPQCMHRPANDNQPLVVITLGLPTMVCCSILDRRHSWGEEGKAWGKTKVDGSTTYSWCGFSLSHTGFSPGGMRAKNLFFGWCLVLWHLDPGEWFRAGRSCTVGHHYPLQAASVDVHICEQ